MSLEQTFGKMSDSYVMIGFDKVNNQPIFKKFSEFASELALEKNSVVKEVGKQEDSVSKDDDFDKYNAIRIEIAEKTKNTTTRMKKIREEKGITQQKMADICGLSKNYISALERNINRCSMEILLTYANVLEVPVSHIVGDIKENSINAELSMLISSQDEKMQEKILKVVKAVLS